MALISAAGNFHCPNAQSKSHCALDGRIQSWFWAAQIGAGQPKLHSCEVVTREEWNIETEWPVLGQSSCEFSGWANWPWSESPGDWPPYRRNLHALESRWAQETEVEIGSLGLDIIWMLDEVDELKDFLDQVNDGWSWMMVFVPCWCWMLIDAFGTMARVLVWLSDTAKSVGPKNGGPFDTKACEVGDVDISMMIYDVWFIKVEAAEKNSSAFLMLKKFRRLWGPNRIELCDSQITWTVAASTKLCCIVGLEWSAWKGGTGAIWPGKQKKGSCIAASVFTKIIKIILEGSSLGFGDWALLATGFLHSWLNGKPLAYALANGAYVGAPGMGTTTRTTVRIRRGNLLWSSFEVATAKLQSSLGARSFLSSSAPTWQSERYQEGDDQKIGCNIFLCVHAHSPVCIVIQHVFRHSDSGHVLDAPDKKCQVMSPPKIVHVFL